MKIVDLLHARKAIGAHVNDSVSSHLAYKIMKLLKTTDQEEIFFSQQMSNLIEKYSEKGNDGKAISSENGGIRIQSSLVEECNLKITDLQNTEVDTPKITFMLGELDEIKMTASEMMALDALIVEATE